MRHLAANPFIAHECATKQIAPAPIPTNVYETYGQCNEDLIVEALLRARLSQEQRQMNSVRYLEIGANHPVQTSATYLLYRLYGATGILVEANPKLVPTLRRVRPLDTVVGCAITATHDDAVVLHIHDSNELTSISRDHIAQFVSFGGVDGITETMTVQNLHINEFLGMYVQSPVDFFSVDIEGFDAQVLDAMDTDFRPSIIQCEHEQRLGDFTEIMRRRRYLLAAVTDVNAIFVRADWPA
ncbi:MAG: FkbM family methyltransferase [Solirubrobacteraceae bacterium]